VTGSGKTTSSDASERQFTTWTRWRRVPALASKFAALAGRAIAMQGEILRSAVELDEPAWPTTLEEADVLDARARLTRELIELRDAAGGGPQEEEEEEEDRV
jgi:hypothetical protein